MSLHGVAARALRRAVVVIAILMLGNCAVGTAEAQTVSFGQVRPFVTGFIPVIGPRGAVGGVLVDAEGVVARAEIEEEGRVRAAWQSAMRPLPPELSRTSPLRKVSLRRLEAALVAQVAKKEPPTLEMNCLAGLQQVQYVFVYPEQQDLVLAGPAEGWRITQHGALVGQASGRPVLALEDLLVALRSSEEAAKSGILCSIDPTEAGLKRLQRILRSRTSANSDSLRAFEQALGFQVVTVEGVPPESRFARTMVAADVLMKRMALGFEAAPVGELPSYLQMLTASNGPARTMTPRWWLAPDYAPLRRDAEGLAWKIGERHVKALCDEGPDAARGGSIGDQWAERFTARYDELAAAAPVFADLQNCMDVAVVAALVAKEDLRAASGFSMDQLLDPAAIPVAAYTVPQTIPSQASAIAKGRETIVSISGGVECDPWRVAEQVETDATIATARAESIPAGDNRWWWD